MAWRQGDKTQKSIYWILAVFIGMILFFAFNYSDISTANNPVKLGKRAAESIAKSYWMKEHVDLDAFERTAILQDDTTLDGYVSLHHLDKAYQKQFAHVHPIQYWEVTYYKQGQPFQYVTKLNPTDGSIIGFTVTTSQTDANAKKKPLKQNPLKQDPLKLKHLQQTSVLADNAGGSSSNSKATMSLGTSSLTSIGHSSLTAASVGLQETYTSLHAIQQFAEKQLANLKQKVNLTYLSRSQETDATKYIFQVNNKKIGQAPLRVEVEMFHGSNQPKGFSTSFAVPQTDKNWFRLQSKRSDIMTWVFMAGQFLFFVAAVVVLYRKRRQDVRYGTGFWLIVLAFFLDVLINLNSLPTLQSQMGFSTIAHRSEFHTDGWIAFFIIITSVLEVGMLYFVTVAGGVLSKEILPDRWLSFRHPDWPRRIQTAAFRGYALAIIWLGLQTLFYYIGQTYFHVWEQNDTSSSPWNNVLPTMMPVAAWFAGINEELTFRLFGYSLFKSWFKNKWVALVVPAMIWALGHSLYPVFPIYTRFIELTIFGTLIGLCMLRWNLETVIFAHISFDVILMSLSLLSDQPVSMLPAAVVWGVSPLLVGAVIGRLRPGMRGEAVRNG